MRVLSRFACPLSVCVIALASCARAPLGAVAADTSSSTAAAAHNTDPARAPARLTAIDFEFELDAALDTLRARVCFHGRPPSALLPGMQSDEIELREAWLDVAGARRPLAFDREQLPLRGVPDDACIGYAIAFDASSSHFGGPAVERRGDAIVANIAGWLWRPSSVVGADVELHARFKLPQGMHVSVPWAREGDRYQLDPSAFVFYAFAAFGRFETEQIDVGGARIEVTVLDGLPPATRANVVPWLRTAASMASLAVGRFPRKYAQVVVVPSPEADVPVRYGMMNRGGGSSALMLLPVNATRDALERDWVAVHEFCHLLHPFVRREDAWLSEGLATYLQEVLRARAGAQPEQVAWKRIYDGAQLGAETTHGLGEESAQMSASGSYRRVYWAGAALALMLDVEVRRRTHGQRSLPSVLGELLPEWLHEPRAFSALEVAEHFDRALGSKAMQELMQRWVDADRMPNLDALYASLGIEVTADGVRFSRDAADASIRDDIMRKAAAQASSETAPRTP